MVEYRNGNICLEKLEVSDIIDIDVLQDFLDNFALGMNCAAVAVDSEGKEITKPSYYRDFCQKQIHMSQLGDKRCAECHNHMGQEALKLGKPYVGNCHAGLIDFAAPITVNGHHIGTVLGGQILNKQPNIVSLRNVANDLGLNPDEVEAAAERIDIVSDRNIRAAAEVLYVVVNEMAQSGFGRLEIEYLSNTLAENFMQISKAIEMLTNSAVEITDSQHELETEIQGVQDLANEIAKINDSIAQVAKKTKMIGLNASIEAARLGESGKGFAVVANEIQHLSGNTTATTSQVSNLNQRIVEKIQTTIENSHKTLAVTEDQSAAMEELCATIQNSVELAESIKDLFA
ncbi:MAG: PocR ligand-binding domain-containing protein [Lachnospiraceae bacterium]|nr:PocR ligand-binding domain-containing protein [Lachnospiraceae bacterium]MCI5588118.1 PocR ligand-binding domain-containing protein [Lachnospiraceae bacterium]